MTAALAVVPDLPLRAAIYCRLSLDKDGAAESVADQETEARELCERRGFDVAEVLTDNDISAYSGAKRPGYDRLIDLVQRGEVDVVVAPAVRTGCSVPASGGACSCGDCQRQHVLIATVQEGDVDLNTPEGEFMVQIAGNLAQLESARIGKRVRARHPVNAQRGKAHGGIRPYGYQRVGSGGLAVVPAEAALIREAAQRILHGASVYEIVVDFDARGVHAANGGRWRPGSLIKMLRSGRIAGLREVDGEVLGEGNWEVILDRATWERVRSRMRQAPIGARPRRNLLASMCRCAECGAPMATQSEATGKRGRRGYRCDQAQRGGCGSNTVKAEAVEEIVLAYVFAALPHVNLAQARARRSVDASGELVESIAADEQMLVDLAADHGSRRISRAEWLAASDPIRERLAASKRALDRIAGDSDLEDMPASDGLTAEKWGDLTLDQQRAVVRLFVDHVEIRKGRPGRIFDPSRVTVVPA